MPGAEEATAAAGGLAAVLAAAGLDLSLAVMPSAEMAAQLVPQRSSEDAAQAAAQCDDGDGVASGEAGNALDVGAAIASPADEPETSHLEHEPGSNSAAKADACMPTVEQGSRDAAEAAALASASAASAPSGSADDAAAPAASTPGGGEAVCFRLADYDRVLATLNRSARPLLGAGSSIPPQVRFERTAQQATGSKALALALCLRRAVRCVLLPGGRLLGRDAAAPCQRTTSIQ